MAPGTLSSLTTKSAGHTDSCAHIKRLDYLVDLLSLHQALPQRYPHILQSVAKGTAHARFDILFAFPGDSLTLDQFNNLSGAQGASGAGLDFLEHFDYWWSTQRVPQEGTPNLPFCGGWFVYLGYELAAQVETRLRLPLQGSGLPIARATRIPAAIITDHDSHGSFLVAEAEQRELLASMEQDLQQLGHVAPRKLGPGTVSEIFQDDAQDFIQGVNKIKDYIVAGDVFQVNLSRAWYAHVTGALDAVSIYDQLCRRNPAPFAGLARFGDKAVLSSSPERLVRVSNGCIETRPIAGTRPRSITATVDRANSQTLLAHPKERAEHIMLIDLERNDLGRVCVPGSVEVSELMILESYAHVHHIVSNIRGIKRNEVSPGEVIRAVFPGGTITGCPKVRCMEIIAELEKIARGPYTGAMGYINRDGSMDLNILIRTMVLEGERLTIRAGAGIVADSVPERELEETHAKAKGLLLALGGLSND